MTISNKVLKNMLGKKGKKRKYHLTYTGRAGRRNAYNYQCNKCGRYFEADKDNFSPSCPDCDSFDVSRDYDD